MTARTPPHDRGRDPQGSRRAGGGGAAMIPAPLLPRLLRAPAAAAYLGISATKLRGLDLPRKWIDGCSVYDRLDLDRYADALPYEGDDARARDAAGAAWDEVLGQ